MKRKVVAGIVIGTCLLSGTAFAVSGTTDVGTDCRER